MQGWPGAGNILQALQLSQLLQGIPGMAPQGASQPQLNNLNLLIPTLANAMQARI